MVYTIVSMAAFRRPFFFSVFPQDRWSSLQLRSCSMPARFIGLEIHELSGFRPLLQGQQVLVVCTTYRDTKSQVARLLRTGIGFKTYLTRCMPKALRDGHGPSLSMPLLSCLSSRPRLSPDASMTACWELDMSITFRDELSRNRYSQYVQARFAETALEPS